MSTLESDTCQNSYARMCVKLHRDWKKIPENQRKRPIEEELKKIAEKASIKMPTIIWGEFGNCFAFPDWQMKLSSHILRQDPDRNFRKTMDSWLHQITSPYHELRHAEQHLMMLRGFYAERVLVPFFLGDEREGELPHKFSDIEKDLGYRLDVMAFARNSKAELPNEHEKLQKVREWVTSRLGSGLDQRDGVHRKIQDAMTADAFMCAYGSYRQLPMEKDAFEIQIQLKRKISGQIQEAAGDDALRGMRSLFD